MSCATTGNYIAKVAARISAAISPLASKRGFYAGTAVGSGGVLGLAILAAKSIRQRRANSSTRPAIQALIPARLPQQQLPRLPARTQLKPVNPSSTDRCASCKASAQAKSGGWYTVGGKSYCQDCAPAAAREAKVDLTAPPKPVSSSTTAAAAAKATGPEFLPLKKRIRTKTVQTEVKVKMGVDTDKNPIHYAVNGFLLVRTTGKPTGLALTPALQTETQPNGDVAIHEDRSRWYLTHARSGVRIGPQPYASVEDAQGIAEILAQIDWTRPKDKVTQTDQQRALNSILLYNDMLSSQGETAQTATVEQVPSAPPPSSDVAPPTPSTTPPAPSPAVDLPRPGMASFPAVNLSRNLEGKIIADGLGGIGRVLADEGDVLFVVGAFGNRYEIYRDQVWAPHYEDFNAVRVAQPINTAKSSPKHCSGCNSSSAQTPASHAWYRMDWKSFCPSCAVGYAEQEAWELDLGTIDSDVK